MPPVGPTSGENIPSHDWYESWPRKKSEQFEKKMEALSSSNDPEFIERTIEDIKNISNLNPQEKNALTQLEKTMQDYANGDIDRDGVLLGIHEVSHDFKHKNNFESPNG